MVHLSGSSLTHHSGFLSLNPGVVVLLLKVRLKALANEDRLLRTHCCRHKCLPVCPRPQHLLRTQKMFLILFRNIFCPQQMFPSLFSPRNIMATMCPQQCVLVYQGLYMLLLVFTCLFTSSLNRFLKFSRCELHSQVAY